VGSGPTNAKVGGTGYGKSEKKLKPSFTRGNGQKQRTQGKNLWNLYGMKIFIERKKIMAGL
jgi:hypothetical protein